MLALSTWTKSPLTAAVNLIDDTAPGLFAHISPTYLTQAMQHFDRTQSMFSKFIKIFRLPGPDRICWLSQLGQNRLSPRRSTSATLQLRASLHTFPQRIWHKLCNISIELRVYFPYLSRHFAYQAPIKYAGPLNLDKIAYHRGSQPQRLQLRASLHIFLQRIWHKLCNISIELRVYFPNLSRHFAYQAQI